ncbi:RluA family pseudouridine synthase [Calditerrivibrio nitroreducens]|uniref:Pseudouridine synthase n=1 Tax=Calditerrivibrio nitroreducens (strain DSM 19672 / NBRC 101217 / Yu37-1) TaxID=768670 RepID=E4TJX3_CALNY|nr:RluA family pseudouridine synthase [Calditerrivibrio nitroreducens]ADR18224.1 pseudouridine synthase, RluA family [Calditerrivibrio nitroreducens DSM 19672]
MKKRDSELLLPGRRIIDKLDITSDSFSERIDIFLSEKLNRSRSYFKNLIDEGLVTLNGKICKPSSKVVAGDHIIVLIPDDSIDLTPKEIDFEVIYDSKWYAVINKPAGLVVHPAPGNTTDTLVNGLLAKFKNIDDNDNVRPGIIHRLDKDTSGLLIIAKNRDVRQQMSELFQKREVKKVYLAVCMGEPKNDYYMIDNFIGRSLTDRKKMAVLQNGGKRAVSEVKILKRSSGIFLASVAIHTGRTHQIRVHMSYLNYPILGDFLYGGAKVMKYGINRQALHAYKISFFDFYLGREVSYIAEIPEDIKYLITKYRLDFDINL